MTKYGHYDYFILVSILLKCYPISLPIPALLFGTLTTASKVTILAIKVFRLLMGLKACWNWQNLLSTRLLSSSWAPPRTQNAWFSMVSCDRYMCCVRYCTEPCLLSSVALFVASQVYPILDMLLCPTDVFIWCYWTPNPGCGILCHTSKHLTLLISCLATCIMSFGLHTFCTCCGLTSVFTVVDGPTHNG